MIGRLIARVALTKALTHKRHDGTFPTIAGDRVFDSKISPVELDENNAQIPIIMVYTNKSMMGPKAKQIGPGFNTTNHILDVIIEIAVAAYEEQEVTLPDGEKANQGVLTIIETDGELMAVLDIMESQVWRVLHDNLNPWTIVFATLAKNGISYESEAQLDGEKNNRYALRQIKLQIEVCPDPIPAYGVTSEIEPIYPPGYVPNEFPAFAETDLDIMIGLLLQQPDTSSAVMALRSTLGGENSILLPAMRRVGMVYRGHVVEQDPKGLIIATQEIETGE